MSFDQLSDELLLGIAKELVALCSGDNRSLRGLGLSSRRLNNMVSPILYRKFTQGHKLASLPNLLRSKGSYLFVHQ